MNDSCFSNEGQPYDEDREDGIPMGLFLSGYVADRVRRYVPKEKPTTEIVTYTIDDKAGHKYYVDDYMPGGYFELGECISVPVYIKPYIKKNKEASYAIGILKTYSNDRGERF